MAPVIYRSAGRASKIGPTAPPGNPARTAADPIAPVVTRDELRAGHSTNG